MLRDRNFSAVSRFCFGNQAPLSPTAEDQQLYRYQRHEYC